MKNKLRYVLFISVCLGQIQEGLASDTLRIKTKLAFGTKGQQGTFTVPSNPSLYGSEYRGYPRCDTSAMTVAVLDIGHYFYGLYKEKRHTSAQFLERVKRYSLDTAQLASGRARSYVSIFTGLKGPKKIVIVDANNNHDFSDDTSFEFDTLTTERRYYGDTAELAPVLRVNYETVTRQGVQPTHTYLRVKPYDKAYGYPQDMQRRLAVYTQPMVYREGTFEVAGKAYKLNVPPSGPGWVDDYTKSAVTIQLAGMDYSAIKEPAIQTGKEMLVGDQLFTLIGSTRDGEVTLVAERYDPDRIGGRVRNMTPMLLGVTDDGTDLLINELLKKGNYVLLDFWGSWCGPCIASMPALKALHDRVKTDKIQFVGVDYEYSEEGRGKARKLEVEKQLSWQQVIEFSGKQTKESIPRQLGVIQYPTFMLLSPEGRILMREVGETGLIAMKAKLAQLGLLTQ